MGYILEIVKKPTLSVLSFRKHEHQISYGYSPASWLRLSVKWQTSVLRKIPLNPWRREESGWKAEIQSCPGPVTPVASDTERERVQCSLWRTDGADISTIILG